MKYLYLLALAILFLPIGYAFAQNQTVPAENATAPAPENMTSPIPVNETAPIPVNETAPIPQPTNETAPVTPTNETAPVTPTNETAPATPTNETAPATPTNETAPATPTNETAPVTQPAPQGGSLIVTGHDVDYHASSRNQTTREMSVSMLKKMVDYVTPSQQPNVLLVTGLSSPDPRYSDPRAGLNNTGLNFDVATTFPAPQYAEFKYNTTIVDISNVNFTDYDVLIVASDYGGWLSQAEIDILNSRVLEIIEFMNNGGGLIVLAQSGLTPDIHRPETMNLRHQNLYGFVPYDLSHYALTQEERGFVISEYGTREMNFTLQEVNSNVAHAYFLKTGGMHVIDVDANGRIITLAIKDVYYDILGENYRNNPIPVSPIVVRPNTTDTTEQTDQNITESDQVQVIENNTVMDIPVQENMNVTDGNETTTAPATTAPVQNATSPENMTSPMPVNETAPATPANGTGLENITEQIANGTEQVVSNISEVIQNPPTLEEIREEALESASEVRERANRFVETVTGRGDTPISEMEEQRPRTVE